MIASRNGSPLRFFILVFALSAPFWLAGTLNALQLLPGLPISSLSFVCPATAALICVYRESKTADMTELMKRCFDYRRIRAKIWYAPTVLLMPSVMVLSYALMRLIRLPLPAPHFTVLATLAMLLVFFVAALGEELGWSGYVIDPMQERWSALHAGILLGSVWAVWHIVPLIQAHRSSTWIVWWCLCTVSERVLIVWIYNNTGQSVFAVAVFHASFNVSWQLFPIHGSYFNPEVTGVVMTFAAIVVAVVWGPRTLARYSDVRRDRPC